MCKKVIFIPHDMREKEISVLNLDNMDIFDKIKTIKAMIVRIEILLEKMNITLKNSL